MSDVRRQTFKSIHPGPLVTTLADDAPRSLAEVDGQGINLASLDDAVGHALARACSGQGFTLFTLNLDHLVKRRRDPNFRRVYARATFVTADGSPVARLARSQGAKLSRTTGADLVMPLCEAAAMAGLPVYFFGTAPGVLNRAVARIKAAVPGLDIRGIDAPQADFDPLSDEANVAAARIASSGARLCFVALGAPKQELFADRCLDHHPGIGFVCVGAALDFLAGEQSRAPVALRRGGLEWAWRLCADPRRLAIRYARCALLLAELVVSEQARPRLPAPLCLDERGGS